MSNAQLYRGLIYLMRFCTARKVSQWTLERKKKTCLQYITETSKLLLLQCHLWHGCCTEPIFEDTLAFGQTITEVQQ